MHRAPLRHRQVVIIVEEAAGLVGADAVHGLQVRDRVALARSGREEVILAKVHRPGDAVRQVRLDARAQRGLDGRIALCVDAEAAIIGARVALQPGHLRLKPPEELPQRLRTLAHIELSLKRAAHLLEALGPRLIERIQAAAVDARSCLANVRVRGWQQRLPLEECALSCGGDDDEDDTPRAQLSDQLDGALAHEAIAHGGRWQQPAHTLLARGRLHDCALRLLITTHNLDPVLLKPRRKMHDGAVKVGEDGAHARGWPLQVCSRHGGEKQKRRGWRWRGCHECGESPLTPSSKNSDPKGSRNDCHDDASFRHCMLAKHILAPSS